jgi:hypothetical protein
MRTRNHNTTTTTASWCHQAQRAGVVVVRPVSGQVSVVLMDSITRIADAKPAPSGQDRGVP